MRARVRGALLAGLLAATVGALGAAGPAAAATVVPGPADPADTVVLLGTAGLTWADVTAETAPTLSALADEAATGQLVVRSLRRVSCPADGWLALSAGRRAADLATTPDPTAVDGGCRPLADPADGETTAVPAWESYLESADRASYVARPGLLGTVLARHEVPVAAIGPGAAIALAQPDGLVHGGWSALPADPAALGDRVAGMAAIGYRLVVVDLGTVTGPAGPEREAQVAALDARVAAVLTALHESPDAGERTRQVMVASLADVSGPEALRLLAATTVAPGSAAGTGAERAETSALLSSPSTRQPGLVQTTDLAPTLLAALGVDPVAGAQAAEATGATGTDAATDTAAADPTAAEPNPEPAAEPDPDISSMVGSAVTAQAVAPGAARATLDDLDRHARAAQPLYPWWGAVLLVTGLGVLALTALALGDGRRTRLPARRHAAARTWLTGAALLPVATYLANAVPWWRAPVPPLALGLTVLAIVAAGVALTRWGPLRRLWSPSSAAVIGLVAGLTVVVLGADVATGGRLQLSALMGLPPPVGGRFYGMHNQGFALTGTASLLLAAVLAGQWLRRGARRAAVTTVVVVGVVVTVLDGAPGLGADFGGPPALVPAFALLALLVAGIRVTWRHVLGVLAAGVGAVALLAWVDWLRPEDERSHLGAFVDTVLSGQVWPAIARKLDQNVGIAGGVLPTALTLAAMAGLTATFAARLHRAQALGGLAEGWAEDHPALDAGLGAVVVFAVLGYALNDSGPVIPALAGYLSVALLGATVIDRWSDRGSTRAAPAPQPPVPAGR